MKTIYQLLIPIFLIFSMHTFAQLDTLNYVKQFEINKINYINQPFSKLLNEMTQIQPKTSWTTVSYEGKKYYTLYNFCDIDESFSNAVTLTIEWQNPIPMSQTDYYENKNGFFFTNDERTFYGGKIVKNIRVYR